MNVRDGETIYHQGAALDAVYRVQRGYVKLTRLTRDGGVTMLALLRTGDWFGALDGCGIAVDSASAKGPALLRPRPRAEALASPSESAELIAALARQQRQLARRLEALQWLDVRARLAAVLLDLAETCGQHCRHGHEIDVRLTHQELAELAGISRPVVTATLNRWRSDKLVAYTRQYICIEQRETFADLIR